MIIENENIKNKLILLVEDESVIAMSIEEVLYSLGYINVHIALSVNEALELFEKKEYDMVIMDINLNDYMDGIDLAKVFKKKKELPVLFLTGNSDQLTISKAKYIEPNAFIVKPFEEKDLRINLELAFFQHSPVSSTRQKNDQLSLDHSFFNNNPNLIMRIGSNDIFLHINTAISRVSGKQPDFYNGKTLLTSGFDQEMINQLTAIVENVKAKKRKVFTEIAIQTIMGERMMNIVAIPEVIHGKDIFSIVIVFQDITDQKISATDLTNRNKKILDSINYSKKIQEALLPDEVKIKQYLPNSFIMFKPKDIVSGDFPWVYKKDNFLYLAVVDCTGHGVPGALMSIITHFLLNDIVKSGSNILPNRILDFLHVYMKKTLKQHFSNIESNDGADIALCRIDLESGMLHYSGAHRPLIYIRNNQVNEIKGDRQPIGGEHYSKKTKNLRFTDSTLQLEEGDFLYMFSDGLTDQFGGPNEVSEKIGMKRVREVLLQNCGKSSEETSERILDYFYKWKGSHKQMDDVLLVGFNYQSDAYRQAS